MGSRLKTAFSTAAKVAGIALAGGAAVGAKRSIDAAVDLGEQINKTRVVFRGSEQDILRWSQATDTGLGISRRAALEAAGTFGNMLVPMGFAREEAGKMSTRMVDLAADMASFNNVDPSETLDAIRAGLAGETEPLRRLGVFLNDVRLKQEALNLGLKDAVGPNGALTANARTQAAYSLILKDTSDAQGDFARTSDSLANKQRVLKAQLENIAASLGVALLPALEKGASALSDFADDVSKTLNRKDLTAAEKFDRIGDEIAKRLEAAIPVVTEAAARIGAKIAGALFRGFVQAPPLVQLVAGAWIFAKSRKLLAAFGLLGRQSGAAFAAGASSTAGAGLVPGAAGAAAAGGAGGLAGGALAGAAGGAAGGAAAKQTKALKLIFGPEARSGAPISQLGPKAGGLSSLAAKMKPLAKTAGFVGVGVAVAEVILGSLEDRMGEGSEDVSTRLKSLSQTTTNELVKQPHRGAIGRAVGFDAPKEEKQAKQLQGILDQVKDSHIGITAATRDEGRALARNLDLTKQQRDAIGQTLKEGHAKQPLAGAGKKAVVDFTRELASGKKDVSATVTDLLSGLDGLEVGAQRKASRFALNWAAGLRQTGHLSRKEFRVIKGIIENNLGEIGGISVGGPRKLLRRMGFTFDEMVEAVRHPTSQMGQIVANALEALGEGQAAKNIRTRVTANQLQRSGKGPAAKQIRLPKAKGGFLGGRGLKDTVPIMAAPGEAVLNRHQQRPVETALRQTYGYGLGDLFKREQRPHYFAQGGFVSRRRHEDENVYYSSRTETSRKLASVVEKATRLSSTKPDEGSPRGVPSEGLELRRIAQVGESVAPLVQKVSRAFSGTSPELPSLVQRVAFARGGRVGRKKSGIVPIPGQPGESIHSSILGDVMALIRRYKLKVTDGYAPSGHAAGGEHPKGLAIDAVPGRGGSWELIDKLAKWAEPTQGSPRKPFRWVGYTGDSGHGSGNHIHLSWGGGGGGVGPGVDVPKLPRVRVEGGTRVTRGLAQAGVDKVRAAAQSLLDKQAGASGAPVGTSSDPGLDRGGKGGSPAANRRLGRSLMRRFWSDKEWPALARLWQGESGWSEKAVNPSSGAGGIPQALPASKMGKGWQGNARQQINWGLRYIKGRYGSPSKALAAWKARSPHWYAQGGFVGKDAGIQAFAKGGTVRKPREQEEPRKRGSVAERSRNLLKRIWPAAAPFYGQADRAAMPPTGIVKSFDTSTLTDAAGKGKKVYIHRDDARGLVRGNVRDMFNVIHEWAHFFQNPEQMGGKVKDGVQVSRSDWKVEGGAEAFARRVAPAVYKAVRLPFRNPVLAGAYAPFVRRVRKEKGEDWIMRGQFTGAEPRAKGQAKARGGFVDEVVYAARGRRPLGRRLLPDPKPRPRPKRPKRLPPRPPARPPGRKLVPDVIGRAPKPKRPPTRFSPGLPGMERHVPAIRKAIKRNRPKNLTGAYAETHGRTEHETVKRVQGPSLATTIGRRIMRGEGLFGRIGPKEPKWSKRIRGTTAYQAGMMLGPPTGTVRALQTIARNPRYAKRFTKKQREMLEMYQWGMGSYTAEKLNSLLRQGKKVTGPLPETLDTAFIRKIPSKRALHRGVAPGGRGAERFDRLKVGDEFVDPGFGSTTSEIGIATEFGAHTLGPSRAGVRRYKIEADRGTPYIGIGGPEREVLLQRGRRYKVVARRKIKGGEQITLKMLPDEALAKGGFVQALAKGGIVQRTALALTDVALAKGGRVARAKEKRTKKPVAENLTGLEQLFGMQVEGPAREGLGLPSTEKKGKKRRLPQLALGGMVKRTALALVGEQGPELAKLPDGVHTLLGREGPEIRELPVRTRVFSHPETKRKVRSVVEKVTRVLPGADHALPGLMPTLKVRGLRVLPLPLRNGPVRDASRALPGLVVRDAAKVGRVGPGIDPQSLRRTTRDTHPPLADAQFVSHALSLPTTSLATGGTVRRSSIFERTAKRTGIQAFAKGGLVRPDDDERDFRKKTGGTKPKGLKIPPGGPSPGKGYEWDAAKNKHVRKPKRKPFEIKQLDFLNAALDRTIPGITDLIQSKQDVFDLTDEEFYPDERVIPRLRREQHNIQTIKDGTSKSFIDWSAVEQRKSEITQILAESFRLIGTPFGQPRGVMEMVADSFAPLQKSVAALVERLKREVAEIKRRVRENMREIKKLDKQIEEERGTGERDKNREVKRLDDLIERERDRKKPNESKIRRWEKERDEAKRGKSTNIERWSKERNELADENRRLTGERAPESFDNVDEGSTLGQRIQRHTDAQDALDGPDGLKQRREQFLGASGIGGDFASQRNNIQQLVKDLSTLTTERITESVAPIAPSADEMKADQRAFLAAIGDLHKMHGPNFWRLPGFQRGGMIAGLGSGDKVPVLAEPGEGFINKRAVMAMGGPAAIERINKLVPRFQTGGVVASPIQVTAPKGSQQMVVVKDSKPERQRPEKIVLHEYNGPVTQVQDDDPHVGSRYWAKELAAAI